jgi:hypothetical protein
MTAAATTMGTTLLSESSSLSPAAAWSAAVVDATVVVEAIVVVVGAPVVELEAGMLPGPPATRSRTGPGFSGSGAPPGQSAIHASSSPSSYVWRAFELEPARRG